MMTALDSFLKSVGGATLTVITVIIVVLLYNYIETKVVRWQRERSTNHKLGKAVEWMHKNFYMYRSIAFTSAVSKRFDLEKTRDNLHDRVYFEATMMAIYFNAIIMHNIKLKRKIEDDEYYKIRSNSFDIIYRSIRCIIEGDKDSGYEDCEGYRYLRINLIYTLINWLKGYEPYILEHAEYTEEQWLEVLEEYKYFNNNLTDKFIKPEIKEKKEND